MQEGYKLVRYIKTGFTAERKKEIADRLLKKGTVEIITKPQSRVIARPGDENNKKNSGQAAKPDKQE